MTATFPVAAHLGEDFLARVYRRTHRVMPGAVPDAAALLSFDTLNQILATHRLEPPRLRLSAGGDMLAQHRYTQAHTTRRHVVWHRIQPADLHACLADGATLVLDAIDELHAPIGDLAAGIERVLRTGVQVNAYASWTATEGFGTHWDDHDTLIVQIEGAKRWRIYGPTRLHPTYRDLTAPTPPQGDPLDEFVLHPGDLLYVPRGHWHAVCASEGVASLHLTCGLQTTTGADLIGHLADELREDDLVRADLPQFADHAAQAAYLERLRKHLDALFDDPDLMQRYFTHRDATDPGRLTASLPYLTVVPADPDLTLRLTTPRAHLDDEPDGVRLRAAGHDWSFAPAAGPLLAALLPGAPVRLGELAALADIPLADVAALATELTAHQAAAVGRA
jgi:hypothetical protein